MKYEWNINETTSNMQKRAAFSLGRGGDLTKKYTRKLENLKLQRCGIGAGWFLKEKGVVFCVELWKKSPPGIYKDLKRSALRAQEFLEKLRAPAHRASGGWARAAILLAGGLDAGLLHSLNHTSSAKTTMPRQASTTWFFLGATGFSMEYVLFSFNKINQM